MDLAETLTEVPVPYSQYIEYQRLEVQVAGLQQQVAELTARAQDDRALIERLTTHLTKDHEEVMQLKQSVRHLSKHSLKNIREATTQQDNLRKELAKREQEVIFVLKREQENLKQLRLAEAAAVSEGIRLDAENQQLKEDLKEAVRAREGAEMELRQLKEEMQQSKLKAREIFQIARQEREWVYKSVIVQGESLQMEQPDLCFTDIPPPDFGLLELISTIKSSSKSYRIKNNKLLLQRDKLKEDLKATISELQEYKKTAESTIQGLNKEVSDLTREMSLGSLVNRNSTDSKPDECCSKNQNESVAIMDSSLSTEKSQLQLSKSSFERKYLKYRLINQMKKKECKDHSQIDRQTQQRNSIS